MGLVGKQWILFFLSFLSKMKFNYKKIRLESLIAKLLSLEKCNMRQKKKKRKKNKKLLIKKKNKTKKNQKKKKNWYQNKTLWDYYCLVQAINKVSRGREKKIKT